jgi:hypothetical protein
MRRHMDGVEVKLRNRYTSPLRTSMPGNLGDMVSLMIELPKSAYYRPRDETGYSDEPTPCLQPVVASLLQHHLRSLTITYHKHISIPQMATSAISRLASSRKISIHITVAKPVTDKLRFQKTTPRQLCSQRNLYIHAPWV